MPEHNQQISWSMHLSLINQALDLIINQKLPAAEIKIVKSLWIQSNHADAYFLLHLCTKEDRNRSLMMLQRAISMNPLCQIYDMQEKKALRKLKTMVQKSIEYEQKLINEKNQLQTSTWYNYTVYLHEETDYQRVEVIYKRLFTKYPELYTERSHAFLGNYANVLYDNGKYDLALQKYEKQIQLNPLELRFFSNCAMLYTIVGNYKKAQQYINQALRGNPDRSTFLFNYANILAKTNRYEESITKIKESIKKEVNDPIFRVKLAITLLLWKQSASNCSFASENLKKALNIFNEAIIKNNLDLVNCNKRILSMKNVICVRIFAQKLYQLLNNQIKWNRLREFLEIFSDYLIVGQATKLQLNQKVRALILQTLLNAKQALNNAQGVQNPGIEEPGELKIQFVTKKGIDLKKIFNEWNEKMNEVCYKPSLQRS